MDALRLEGGERRFVRSGKEEKAVYAATGAQACGWVDWGGRGELVVAGEVVADPGGGDGLGPLEGKAEGAVPEELGEGAEGAGDAEEDGVVVVLGEAVVPEEDARVGVDVGVGVLGLAVLGEDGGHDRVDSVDDLEEGVVRHVLDGEVALAGVAGVGLAEDGVAVAGDDLAGLEGVPGEGGDGVLVDFLALGVELGLEVLDPAEDLLVGEAVEGTGERVESGDVGEVGVGEGGADEVRGVGRGVAALVVGVDDQVEAHELVEARVVHAEHAAEVGRVVERVVAGDDAVEVRVAVDEGGDLGNLREDVEDVLVGVLPVGRLVDAVLVGHGELGLGLTRLEPDGELRHRVHRLRQRVHQRDNVLRQRRPGVEVRRQAVALGLGRDLARQEEPRQRLGDRLAIARRALERRQDALQVRDRVTPEPNPLVRVQEGRLPQHALDRPRPPDALIHRHLVNLLRPELRL
mmetsp:Transcript_7078/g.21611  ORF Transcript_7078/g.21611 Transcript_7078/m.21611 type:complete len:462 (+) Transcript_7078:264-1649(+)